MAEKLDLTTPEVVSKITVSYRVAFIQLDWELKKIIIYIRSDLGERRAIIYEGQQAVDYMRILNKSNFSINSMHKRILQKLSLDGELVGTVSGVPD